MACRASTRSALVSPMPIRMPEVYGTWALPAARMVASRRAGSCSHCGPEGNLLGLMVLHSAYEPYTNVETSRGSMHQL